MGHDPWIRRFRREALPKIQAEFRPERIILFGSRVRGTAHEDSDIDVIIVSTFFQDISFLKRMALALRKIPFPKHVDYFCYTPGEFERIKTESIVIMDALESPLDLEI